MAAYVADEFGPDVIEMGKFLDIAGRVPRLAGRGLIGVYRYTIAPVIGANCRHLPSCSHYADEAIGRFGLWAGGWMMLARLCRCHPFGTSGFDPVPAEPPRQAHWYMPWRYGRWAWARGGDVPRQGRSGSE